MTPPLLSHPVSQSLFYHLYQLPNLVFSILSHFFFIVNSDIAASSSSCFLTLCYKTILIFSSLSCCMVISLAFFIASKLPLNCFYWFPLSILAGILPPEDSLMMGFPKYLLIGVTTPFHHQIELCSHLPSHIHIFVYPSLFCPLPYFLHLFKNTIAKWTFCVYTHHFFARPIHHYP